MEQLAEAFVILEVYFPGFYKLKDRIRDDHARKLNTPKTLSQQVRAISLAGKKKRIKLDCGGLNKMAFIGPQEQHY